MVLVRDHEKIRMFEESQRGRQRRVVPSAAWNACGGYGIGSASPRNGRLGLDPDDSDWTTRTGRLGLDGAGCGIGSASRPLRRDTAAHLRGLARTRIRARRRVRATRRWDWLRLNCEKSDDSGCHEATRNDSDESTERVVRVSGALDRKAPTTRTATRIDVLTRFPA